MFAGLPGTGIGGIFYLLLTLWMPVNELYLTAKGRSSAERWKFIAYRWAVFAFVIALLWVQAAVVTALIGGERLSHALRSDRMIATGETYLGSTATVALTGLALVVLLLYVVRLALIVRSRVTR